jgi:hypothetical protein
MLTRVISALPVVLGLVASACALVGYDFGEYERDSTTPRQDAEGGVAGATEADATAKENGTVDPIEPMPPVEPLAPFVAPYAAGGAHDADATPSDAAGAGGAAGTETRAACEPRGCLVLEGQRCGVTDDGCGAPLDCGTCFWPFQECEQSMCRIRL